MGVMRARREARGPTSEAVREMLSGLSLRASRSDRASAGVAPEASPRIYYGWVVVAALAAIGSLSVALAGINFGFFIRPMSQELGTPQAFFGLAISARQLGMAASSTVIGPLVDRFGARVPLIVTGVCAGLIVVSLSRVTAGWQLIALFLGLGVIGLQGVGGDLYTGVPIAKWFERDRGRAMSVAFMGIPVGIFVFAPLSQFLIDQYGWRSAFQILGAVCASLVVLIALAVRRRPQDMGLLPDGASPEVLSGEAELGRPASDVDARRSWTRAQALRSGTFWRLALIFGVLMFSIGTVAMFRIPHFMERGVDPQLVAFAFSAEALASMLFAFPVGIALDRYEPRYVAVGALLLMSGAVAATMLASSAWHVLVATILFGLGAVSFVIVQSTLWPAYFGAFFIGSIRGVAMPITMGFSVAGAPVAGMVKDATGSFLPIWSVALVGLLVATAAMLATRPPGAPPERPGD